MTDSLGRSQATTLTFNVTGTDDAPVITHANALGSMTEDAGPTVAVNGGFETGDLTGYSSSGVSADPLFLGGEFGNYSASLSGSGFLEQDVATTAGQHYIVSFYVAGDAEASSHSLQVFWDGAQISRQTDVTAGFTKYTFDLVGDGSDPTTQLFFSFSTDGTGLLVDQISITPTPGPAAETTNGSIAFTDVETADTHTASFTPDGSGYVGTFSLDPVSESGGSGSLAWHYSVDNADIQFLAQGQTLVQTYSVTVDRRSRRLDAAGPLPSRSTAPTTRRPRSTTRSLPTPGPTALSSSRRGRWGRTTPIRIRPTMSSSTASAPAPAAARAALLALHSSPMTPRSADRSPTMPATVTPPAAISPP